MEVRHACPPSPAASTMLNAVYIALPNDLHKDFALRAAKQGIHVLCEKPQALSERDSEEMIRVANEHHVRLMTAYRLHFSYSMQVKDDNIRFKTERGGGPTWDLGVYCINAARYLFRDEPTEVIARMASKADDALAYDYGVPTTLEISKGGKSKSKEFGKRDQVAPEILYFSDCVLNDREPEPSGLEGLADVRIIRAIHESACTGKPVALERFEKRARAGTHSHGAAREGHGTRAISSGPDY